MGRSCGDGRAHDEQERRSVLERFGAGVTIRWSGLSVRHLMDVLRVTGGRTGHSCLVPPETGNHAWGGGLTNDQDQ